MARAGDSAWSLAYASTEGADCQIIVGYDGVINKSVGFRTATALLRFSMPHTATGWTGGPAVRRQVPQYASRFPAGESDR